MLSAAADDAAPAELQIHRADESGKPVLLHGAMPTAPRSAAQAAPAHAKWTTSLVQPLYELAAHDVHAVESADGEKVPARHPAQALPLMYRPALQRSVDAAGWSQNMANAASKCSALGNFIGSLAPRA
jgi:hypothetical protein